MRPLAVLAFLLLALSSLAARPEPVKLTVASRAVLVSLPEGYDKSDERYPVLYMTDGELHLDHTVAPVDSVADVYRMPRLIIVAIPHADRTKDLTPTHLDTHPTSGGGKAFAAFLEKELIPAVDARFRTQPYRVFAGHSYGGLFGLDLLFDRPKLFNAWLIVSPSTFWDDGYILKRAAAFNAKVPELYLMHGDEEEEMAAGVARLVSLLGATYMEFPDDDHVTVPVPAFYAGLRKVFKPWFFRILDTDDPATLYERARQHYRDLSARYGYEVVMPENRFERIGALLLQSGRVDEAVKVFEDDVKAHPKSKNAQAKLREASKQRPVS